MTTDQGFHTTDEIEAQTPLDMWAYDILEFSGHHDVSPDGSDIPPSEREWYYTDEGEKCDRFGREIFS